MTKRFAHISARKVFVISHTGVSIDPDALCAHGQSAAFIALFGQHAAPGSPEERLDVLVPRCVLAELIGALQAQIAQNEGQEAFTEFLTEITGHTVALSAEFEQLRERKRDCCEAGFTTDGREHTCGRTGDQS